MSIDATRWAWVAPVENCPQRVILLSLADRAGEDHKAWPSIKRLTIDTVCDRKTIMKHLDRLEELNLLRFTGDVRGNGVKVYQLNGVLGREDQGTSTKNNTSTKFGTSTKNGTATCPKNGTGTSTKNGTQNLSIESINEPNNICKFNFKNELKKLGADDQLISDWLLVRKNKKATNSQTAFNAFKKQYENSGMQINDVLTTCVSKSWAGFEAAWINKQNAAPVKNSRNVNDAWGEVQNYHAVNEQSQDEDLI